VILKKIIYGVLAASVAVAVTLGVWFAGALNALENATWGPRVRLLAAPAPTSTNVILILLDQASLDWGKVTQRLSWPWPRQVYPAIIDFCRRGGAAAVAFDVLYTEPSVYGVEDDEALGAAVAQCPTFIGAVFLSNKSGDATQWPVEVLPPPTIENAEIWLKTPHRQTLGFSRAAFPVSEIASNLQYVGTVNEVPDPDGIIRRAGLLYEFDGHLVPSLGFAAFLLKQARSEGRVPPVRIEENAIWAGGRRLHLDRQGRVILRYRGAPQVYRIFNAAEIIESAVKFQSGETPTISPEVFSNACVFFGFSAPGLLDLRPTPISPVTPGVFVHATLCDNLLAGDLIRDASPRQVVIWTVFLALSGAVLVSLSRKAWQSAVIFLALLPLPALAGGLAYTRGLWWPVALPGLSTVLAMIGGLIINYATEGRQKAFIKQAFKYYLGPEVIEQILADPSRLKLGGEKRELTIFFSDIEKFSTFSEQLDPPQLTALLNEYLSEMSRIIKEEGGYLDKYIGDAIVAFWNAPLTQPDHAVRAVRAAIRCQRRLAELRPQLQQHYGAIIKMRIGINTGEVVVGNMGSRERFNYTILGDAANLASRLEGANKAFGTFTMMSASTREQAGDRLIARKLGAVRVVGRQTPVEVYEPLGLAGETLPSFAAEFEKGLELCRQGNLSAALAVFEKLGEDPPAIVYVRRCRELLATPGSKWDGVWNLTEKG